MKWAKACIKCGSSRLGHVERVADTRDTGFISERSFGIVETDEFIGTSKRGVGRIEAFVCTECGYFEEYVKDPTAFPWQVITDFRWVNSPPE